MNRNRMHDEEIDEQLDQLEGSGFPAQETVRMAEALAHHAWGTRAERALERVLVELPRDQLNLLVSRHVMTRPDSPDIPDYTGRKQDVLARKVEELGLPLYDGEDEWVSELPTGTKLSLGYRAGDPDESDEGRLDSKGEALCRMALYAVWIRTMRKREGRV